MSDIVETIEKLGDSFESFKQAHDKRLKKLENQVDLVEIRQARLPVVDEKTDVGPVPTFRRGQLHRLGYKDKLSDFVCKEQQIDGKPSIDRELDLGRIIRGLATNNWHDADLEKRAMAELPATSGGFAVPEQMAAEILDLARAKSVVMQAGCGTIKMESASYKIPYLATDPVPDWRGELTSITPSDGVFGQIELTAKTVALLCKMSIELAEDSRGFGEFVGNAIASSIGVEIDRACLLGNGGVEPVGIKNYASVQSISDFGTPTANATTFSKIVEAAGMVLAENGADPSQCSLVMAPRTWQSFEGLADANYQPLNGPPCWNQMRRLVTSQIPTDLGDGSKSVLIYGDFHQAVVGMRTELQLEVSRLAGSAFTDLAIWLRGYVRMDFGLLRPAHFVVIDGVTSGS